MCIVHVAIIDARLTPRLLAGRKRVESRFARRRRLPYGRISPGDQIHFKVSGGDIIGHAPVIRVRQFDDLTPTAIASLRRRYNPAILAPPAYWRARRHCRYGVLIWLGRFTASPTRLAVPRQYGSGWLVLSGAAPQCVHDKTGGAVSLRTPKSHPLYIPDPKPVTRSPARAVVSSRGRQPSERLPTGSLAPEARRRLA